MTISLRKNRHVFKISGPDAQKLLADVFTGSLPDNQNQANWWALLSPQGKIQAEGLMGFSEDSYWLDVSAEIAVKFSKRMGMYKLRANVQIEDLSQTHCVGWSAAKPDNKALVAHKDMRHAQLGFRIIAPMVSAQSWQTKDDIADRTRVNLGIGELGVDFKTDSLFPHDIGMDLLNGIDFDKGCYVGQEVVSRMRHRGNVRRRPIIVATSNGGAGDEILVSEKSVGKIGRPVDGKAIGIVRLDKIFMASEANVNGEPVQLYIPEWANYDFAPASESR